MTALSSVEVGTEMPRVTRFAGNLFLNYKLKILHAYQPAGQWMQVQELGVEGPRRGCIWRSRDCWQTFLRAFCGFSFLGPVVSASLFSIYIEGFKYKVYADSSSSLSNMNLKNSNRVFTGISNLKCPNPASPKAVSPLFL